MTRGERTQDRDEGAAKGFAECIVPYMMAPWVADLIALVQPGLEKLLPPAAGKDMVDGKPAAYVCKNFTCKAPVTTPEELKALNKSEKLPEKPEEPEEPEKPGK